MGESPRKPTERRKLFARCVKAERQKQQLTLRELSERTGLPESFVSEVENGLRNVTLDTIDKFVVALDVPADHLFRERRVR